MSSPIIPTLRYADAPAAIAFLVEAFGFVASFVHEGEDGSIDHAQLTHGEGMVMLGTARDDDYGRHVTLVGDGRPTASVYVVVEDVRRHADRARSKGARIVMEPEDQEYGGAHYAAVDPEGNLWNFGSYDPWVG